MAPSGCPSGTLLPSPLRGAPPLSVLQPPTCLSSSLLSQTSRRVPSPPVFSEKSRVISPLHCFLFPIAFVFGLFHANSFLLYSGLFYCLFFFFPVSRAESLVHLSSAIVMSQEVRLPRARSSSGASRPAGVTGAALACVPFRMVCNFPFGFLHNLQMI